MNFCNSYRCTLASWLPHELWRHMSAKHCQIPKRRTISICTTRSGFTSAVPETKQGNLWTNTWLQNKMHVGYLRRVSEKDIWEGCSKTSLQSRITDQGHCMKSCPQMDLSDQCKISEAKQGETDCSSRYMHEDDRWDPFLRPAAGSSQIGEVADARYLKRPFSYRELGLQIVLIQLLKTENSAVRRAGCTRLLDKTT